MVRHVPGASGPPLLWERPIPTVSLTPSLAFPGYPSVNSPICYPAHLVLPPELVASSDEEETAPLEQPTVHPESTPELVATSDAEEAVAPEQPIGSRPASPVPTLDLSLPALSHPVPLGRGFAEGEGGVSLRISTPVVRRLLTAQDEPSSPILASQSRPPPQSPSPLSSAVQDRAPFRPVTRATGRRGRRSGAPLRPASPFHFSSSCPSDYDPDLDNESSDDASSVSSPRRGKLRSRPSSSVRHRSRAPKVARLAASGSTTTRGRRRSASDRVYQRTGPQRAPLGDIPVRPGPSLQTTNWVPIQDPPSAGPSSPCASVASSQRSSSSDSSSSVGSHSSTEMKKRYRKKGPVKARGTPIVDRVTVRSSRHGKFRATRFSLYPQRATDQCGVENPARRYPR